uniref:LOW QUALITY PROTEIN: C-C motif chemokine 22-like n=1 Tax=Semicossyphus pulcher TaxID=241346 RepID=UPI0037E7571F
MPFSEWITAKKEEEEHHHHHHPFADTIMKTLCFSLGLLLIVCCCDGAIPNALRNITPRNCCFNFYKGSLPLNVVSDIIKTHSSCQYKAFIVRTIRGNKICYSQTFPWAKNVFNKLHKTEDSIQSS